ncbi:MAG: UDP-N-acetylmuramate dehydrogenase [Patescibacteria group bacterium]
MEKIEDSLKGVKRNVSLKNYTTFKIGGSARYFFTAETKDDLMAAVLAAEKLNLPFFILGAGSNLLVSDSGFDGLIIKIQTTKYKILNTKIIAGAGAKLGELLIVSLKNGLAGLEWAAGIPGTLGGAIFGNAGSFGQSIGGLIEKVEVFNTKTMKIESFKNKKFKFGYRRSIFKKNKNLIILSAEIQLKKDDKRNIKSRLEKFLELREESQPLNFPSAGSIFKNSRLGGRQAKGFFAGQLIEKCGLKGKRIGKAEISKKHANFIINLGGAKAGDVKKLITLAKRSIKNKFSVNLEEEIEFLGTKPRRLSKNKL